MGNKSNHHVSKTRQFHIKVQNSNPNVLVLTTETVRSNTQLIHNFSSITPLGMW